MRPEHYNNDSESKESVEEAQATCETTVVSLMRTRTHAHMLAHTQARTQAV